VKALPILKSGACAWTFEVTRDAVGSSGPIECRLTAVEEMFSPSEEDRWRRFM